MFDEVINTLVLIRRTPARGDELRAKLRKMVHDTVKSTDCPEAEELMLVIGFAEQAGYDVQVLVDAVAEVFASLLANETPNTPEKSQRVTKQFQSFSGTKEEKRTLPAPPPAGTVRLSAIAPPKRRFA